jgi:hypothetical protein
MEFVRDYPQVKTAFFNTEVVDTLDTNRNQAGNRLAQELLGFDENDLGQPNFVAPGVIANDDRRYLLHKYKFKRGNGLALANQRTAEMIHRYRPDIITINDPYRYTCLLDMFPGLDVISTWTYTNPDPQGARNEFSGYYCAQGGILNIDFIPALNDTPGRWTVAAVDLTAGLESKRTLELVK